MEEVEDPWFFRPYLIVFDRESIADLNPAFFSVPGCPWRRAGGRKRREDERKLAEYPRHPRSTTVFGDSGCR